MCFSATASFVTAGVTGAIGLVSLTRVRERRTLPLAITPILFALQQGVEGLLWIDLPRAPGESASTVLAFFYLFFAQVFWPVFAPVAVLLIEPNATRRLLMRLSLALGVGVGAFMLWWIIDRPFGAVIEDGHVVYLTGFRRSDSAVLAYFAASCLPLLMSSHRTVVRLGTVILLGSIVSYIFYREAFVSSWCFFAAASSVVILGHFERSYRRRLPVAA
jgi:hypothetical protein